MPCRNGNEENYLAIEAKAKAELDLATRVACKAMRCLEELGAAFPDSETALWWIEHKEQDRLRLQREQEKRQAKMKKKAALAKLTPEERKLLGL